MSSSVRVLTMSTLTLGRMNLSLALPRFGVGRRTAPGEVSLGD